MMNSTRWALISTITILCVVVAGCTIFPPQNDQSRYFILTPASNNASNAGSPLHDTPTIGVGPVIVPEYLRRREVLTRTDGNELKPSVTDRWVEPLDKTIVSTLRQDLAQALNSDRVLAYPW